MTQVNLNEEEQIHVMAAILWNLKVLFQGLLLGLIYGIFLYYFGMISILGHCAKCIDLLTSVTNPSMYFMDILVRIFFVEYFDITKVAFATSSDSLVRISLNVVLVWVIFYATFTRLKINVRTVHLMALSILSMVFLAMSLFSIVRITQGDSGFTTYLIAFVVACVLFGYGASIRFKLKSETTYEEVLLTAASVLFVAFLAIIPLIKLT